MKFDPFLIIKFLYTLITVHVFTSTNKKKLITIFNVLKTIKGHMLCLE